jgi:VWFA-related protein
MPMSGRRALFLIVLFPVMLCQPYAAAQRRGAAPVGTPDFSRLPERDTGRVHYQGFDKAPLKFSARSNYVLVPVIVTDKDGKHVAGLGQADFKIFENGKQQKIASVEEVKAVATPASRPSTSTNEFSNEIESGGSQKRIAVVALDLVNTPLLDQGRAREAVVKFLGANLSDDMIVELVTIESKGVRVIHDFSSDPKILVKALSRVNPSGASVPKVDTSVLMQLDADRGAKNRPVGNPDGIVDVEATLLNAFVTGESIFASQQRGLALNATLGAFHQIGQQLLGVPGRKSLIWITGSFPFDIDAESLAVSEGVPFDAYQRSMQMLSNANIALYPVDARGLVVVGLPDATEHLSRKQLQDMQDYTSKASGDFNSTLDTMRILASMTGGKAFFNTNDIKGAIHEAAQDTAAYYMLTFAVAKDDRKAGWRKLSVKVNNEALHTRTRQGYYLTQSDLDPNLSAALDFDRAINSPLDETGLPLHVRFDAPVADGGKKKIRFALTLPPDLPIIDEADGNRLNLEIVYVVRNSSGQQLDRKSQAYRANLVDEQVKQLKMAGVGWDNTLDLPPGDYSVRFVVRDHNSGRVGSTLARITLK